MPPSSEFKKVAIDDISPTDVWDLHPFVPARPSEQLCTSMAALGLLHPPILTAEEDTNYQLISGRKRLMAFADAFPEETAITALVLPENSSHEQILRYLLDDKIFTRNFSPMEKAYFFRHCLKYMSLEATALKFLPLLAEKVQSHTITKLISLSELEPDIQQSIHSGVLNPKLGLELLALSSKDRMTLHTLFQQLEFGGGKQKRLLSLGKDLSGRLQKSLTELLTEKEFRSILEHPEMNLPQKGASLLSCLHKQLFPQSNRAEEDFNKRVKRMELSPSCTVEHSLSFERDTVQLRVEFPTFDTLEKQLTTIRTLTRTMDQERSP